MAWYAVFVLLRLLVTLFFLLTSAYSILNYSPFVFHQFIRPRIFWWVNQFVAWHHVWYSAAYALSVVTLLPDLLRRRVSTQPQSAQRAQRAQRLESQNFSVASVVSPHGADSTLLRRRLALAYVVVFGLVAEWLVVTPYLPTLWNDRRSFIFSLASFLPVLWLAAIDHVAAWPADPGRGGVMDQRRALATCLLTALNLWVLHLLWAWARTPAADGAPWLFDAAWALSLNLAAAMVLYLVINLVTGTARATALPGVWEYGLATGVSAGAIATVLMTVVFPTIAFGKWEPLTVSLVAGSALALAWSGLALRRPRPQPAALDGIDLLISPLTSMKAWARVLSLVLLPLLTFAALGAVERADWNFLVQKTTVLIEWTLTAGVIFGLTRRMKARPWSLFRLAAPVLAVAAGAFALTRLAPALLPAGGDRRVEVEMALDRYAGRDLSFRLLYDNLIAHPGRDRTFSRYLQMNSSVSTALELPPPDVRFSTPLAAAAGARPHIFLFVVDSMRRDYLSPFNPAVTFTPDIGRFAAENFAFTNAFTRYGGTALAVPSIWAGGLLLHRLYWPNFERTDALEKLLDADGYRYYMSQDTHIAPLLQPNPDLVQLDRDRNIMQFDFCRTLGELERRLDAGSDGRPIFAFSLPQNLHISNRQHGPVPADEHYPGFFAPYAAEVHRVDRCFGEFLAYLRGRGLYDDSIVILTTDHGDSLGEDGNWGHSVTIYPEVVRIPLVIHIPERLRQRVSTDLARVTFSTDIVPTLYALAGHKTESPGPLFGSPLFVPPDVDLAPREDGSFLLASSYAATYGMLRHNGRDLYIADLVNGREYAYDLSRRPLGARVAITDELRNANQRLMREQVGAVGALYRYVAQP